MRLEGCIAEANIINPLQLENGELKYRVKLNPIDNIFQRLESIIEDLQNNWKINNQIIDHSIPPTKIVEGSIINLETIIKPRLLGWCSECINDQEYESRYVQAVGHIEIQKLGNCFLPLEILEPYSQDQTMN